MRRVKTLWTYSTGTLRRLRAYDLNGDGNGEILLGGDGARLIMLDAATGQERLQSGAGSDDYRNPRGGDQRRAVVARICGRRQGRRRVGLLRRPATELWSNNVDDKVTEIAALDVDKDGADETIIGDESGGVVLFAGKTGERFGLDGHPGAIMRIDTEKFGDGRKVVVADDSQVSVYSIEKESAPFFYSPLVVGLLISAAIIVAAWFIASMPQKPAEKIAIEDQSVEGLAGAAPHAARKHRRCGADEAGG